MEEQPYWKRLLTEAARARPDLAYKFKTPAQTAASAVQPGSPAASEVPSEPQAQQDLSFNQENVIPARPVNPFEVRLVLNEAGNPTHIRCYKGVISDFQTGKMSSNSQAAIAIPKRTSKRVKINPTGGGGGTIGSDQADFVPSNYDPGPDQFKYSDYYPININDPSQSTFIPTFRNDGFSSAGSNPAEDPAPATTTQTYGTGGYPYGKDTFNINETLGAYFEWPYQDGAMVRLFCKNASDPETRAWGVWGNSGSPTSLGDDGFFILIAQISGSRVLQFFSSDVVVLGGGGSSTHPFKVLKNGQVGDDLVFQIEAGTVNNKEVSNIMDTFILSDGDVVWLQCDVGDEASGWEYPSTVSVGHGAVMPEDDDESGYVKIAKLNGTTIQQFVTGSLWSDRIKLGSATAAYYYARI